MMFSYRGDQRERKYSLSWRQSRNWELGRTSCEGESPIENLPELWGEVRWTEGPQLKRRKQWNAVGGGLSLLSPVSCAGSHHSNVLCCRNYHGSGATPLETPYFPPIFWFVFLEKYHKILAVWEFDCNWLLVKTTKQDGSARPDPTRQKEFEEFLVAAPAPALAANWATSPGISLLKWWNVERRGETSSATARIKCSTGEFARPTELSEKQRTPTNQPDTISHSHIPRQ